MIFNLGPKGFAGFKNTIASIARGDYADAASRMLQSKWATQVGNRAVRLAAAMRTGVLE
jgi:lysozyme